jgi:hypothetical protein
VGIWGRGLISRDLKDSPTVDETFRLKLQHRLVLELLVKFFTWTKDRKYGKNNLANVHRKLQALNNKILPIISTKLRNPDSSGHTQQTCSQTEGLARDFVTSRVVTAASDGRFMGRLFDWEGLLGRKRPTGTMPIFLALAFHCYYEA